MQRFSGHHRHSWRPRSPHWLLAPVALSVSLSLLGVWAVPDRVLMVPDLPQPGGLLTAPGAPDAASLTPLPPVEMRRRSAAESQAAAAPRR